MLVVFPSFNSETRDAGQGLGYGLATWPVRRAAIRLGRDIRAGLEDTTVLPDGRLASGNAALVEAAGRLAAEPSHSS